VNILEIFIGKMVISRKSAPLKGPHAQAQKDITSA